VCSIVPISATVGANRIVPAVAIPHPLGDPSRPLAEERRLRRTIVESALAAVAAPVADRTRGEGARPSTGAVRPGEVADSSDR
jgi:glycine reductase